MQRHLEDRRSNKAEELKYMHMYHTFQVMNQSSGELRCNPVTDNCDFSVFSCEGKITFSLIINRAAGLSCFVSTVNTKIDKHAFARTETL